MDEDKNKTILYYVHDPMCSWCWGFHQTWQQVKLSLPPEVEIRNLLGGLAVDNDEPMPEELQHSLQTIWKKIEQHIPNVHFNFDFWTQCMPRRSTYPACRAVIAARNQSVHYEEMMIVAIQQAYYQQAKNPSDTTVLISLAEMLGMNKEQFSQQLNHPDTQQQLQIEINLAQDKGIQGFPSLLLEHNNRTILLDINYNKADVMIAQVLEIMSYNKTIY
ncbi:MAG: DsbA family protein [Thiotrichaceae bacterium]|nr:DsbA family protein [Thiotrichaceae bacterium]